MLDYGVSGELLVGTVKLTMEHACPPSYVLTVKYAALWDTAIRVACECIPFFPRAIRYIFIGSTSPYVT